MMDNGLSVELLFLLTEERNEEFIYDAKEGGRECGT